MSGPRHESPITTPRRPAASRAVALFAAAAATALLLSGCGERGDVGIFASIEREEKIEKSNLPEVATAGSVVYDAASQSYYVALGQLFSRSADGNEWDEVDHPGGYADGHTLDILEVAGNIYVAFFDTASTKSELYRLDTNNDSYTKVWNPGKEISELISLDTSGDGTPDELFAVTVESNKLDYDLVFAPGGVAGTETLALDDVPRIIDGTYDTNGNTYLFVAASMLYDGTTPGTDFAELTTRPFATYGGATFVADNFGSANRIYVSSLRGQLAYSTDGGSSWTSASNDDDRRYTDIAYLSFPGFQGLVVGLETLQTSSGGYYEVSSSLGTSRPDGENYGAADISDAAIHGFYVDTTNETLFALTNGFGLWSAKYDTDEPEWAWE